MKNGDSIEQKNQSMKDQSNEAKKSKSSTMVPADKKLHEPNRPSI